MLFNTALFALFFVVFYCLYHFVARSRSQRLWLLVVGSLVFYSAWDVRFTPFLLVTASLDFFLARRIASSTNEVARKRLVGVSVISNLGVLFTFKYSGFFVDNVTAIAHALGITLAPRAEHPSLIIPVGLSFYTFQSISYVVDVYRRRLPPASSLLELVASVSFFPHLVAGPIVRPSILLPQFEAVRPPPFTWSERGLVLVAAGLFNKTVADLLAPIVEAVYSSTGTLSAATAWRGVLAFAGQVYGDFAGYSEIAIGTALLLGFELPRNFELPYVAASPVELWRRWHMSLSGWLRDYLYIPLGGNQRRTRSVLLTMTLGGLWHGAAWTYVAWGAFHGVIVRLSDFVLRGAGPLRSWRRVLGVLATFYLWNVGLVLFRSRSLSGAARLFASMHAPGGAGGVSRTELVSIAVVVAAICACHLVSFAAMRIGRNDERIPSLAWGAVVVWLTLAFSFGGAMTPFIYFQF